MLQAIFVLAVFLATPSSSILLHGSKAVNPAWNITLDLTITQNSTVSNVLIEIHGPTDRWFGVGFGANQMSGTYAITSTGSNGAITERQLGNHEQGSALQASVTVLSNVNHGDGFRTVQLSRSVKGASSSYYTFPTTATSINLICARGDSSGATSLAFHGDTNYHNGVQITLKAIVSPTSSPTKKPTAVPTTPIPTSAPVPTKQPSRFPSKAPTPPTTSSPTSAPVTQITYYGYALLSSTFGQKAYVTVSVTGRFVKMLLYGKADDTWFGIGFDATAMNGTYAIVTLVDGIQERRLGNHEQGDTLSSSFWNTSVTSSDGHKIVTITTSYDNANFDWQMIANATSPSSFQIPMIWSKGQGETFEYHGSNRGFASMTFDTTGFQDSAKSAFRLLSSFGFYFTAVVVAFIALL